VTRAGAPPPWAALAPKRRHLSLAEVRARCALIPPPPVVALRPGRIGSAVLLPVFEAAGETRLVLTKRPETMAAHRGEIAFPGGKIDPVLDASERDTALREAEEEIGLRRELVDVVARLESVSSAGNQFTMAPFVGLIEGRPSLAPDAREVDRLLEVPLAELLDRETFREEIWVGDAPGSERSIFFFELEDETVWGATARILTGFLAHLTGVAAPTGLMFETDGLRPPGAG
jgi:8-oxo-dGTP pyrophosphatase MutT (NUDIX family)